MKKKPTEKPPLLAFKERQSAETRLALNEALDRFESGKLIRQKAGTPLSRKTFALEAGVKPATPFALYPKGHTNAGGYRYPVIVSRFEVLREKLKEQTTRKPKDARLRETISELRKHIAILEEELAVSLRVSIELDAMVADREKMITELKAELAEMRKARIIAIPSDRE